MSVVEMSKLRLVGLTAECDKVLDTLAKSGVFEVCPTEGVDVVSRPHDAAKLDEIVGKQVKAAFALDFLSKAEAEERDKNRKEKHKKRSNKRRVLEYGDVEEVTAREYELLSKADEMEKISFRRAEIKAELARTELAIRALLPYKFFPLKFSEVKDTLKTSRVLVYAAAVTASFDRFDESGIAAVTEYYPTEIGKLALVITLKDDKEKALRVLTESGFGETEFKFDDTAKNRIKVYERQKSELLKEDGELLRASLNYLPYFDDLKVLYDAAALAAEKAHAAEGFVRTQETFVIEGWLPKDVAEEVIGRVRAQTERVCVFLTEPEKDDNPPTLVENPKLIAPFEDVTNLYSPPGYGEIDPNPFMAVFFFIFYGFMMADAGYGVIMTAVALIALKILKPEKGTAKLIALIGICGISTVFWGVLFGGLFGIEGIPSLWFNPLDEPLLMFGLSLALGVVQIVFGYGLYAAKMFRQKKYFAGIIDVVFKFTILVGVGLIMLNLLAKLSSGFATAGIIVIIASLVGIILTAGHAKPTIAGKIVGGFAGLYDLVNLLSDVLSYARLFGLALASSAIALAFNTLGSLFFGIGFIGYVLGIIVLIPLHAFNLGLGLLSGYVHNARLQFIEFFNKFYDGGGRLFNPMGERTKYIRLKPFLPKRKEKISKRKTANAAESES